MALKLSWTDRFLFSPFFRKLVLSAFASIIMLMAVVYFFG